MANSSAKSSNFAVTCSLLSHYMKEKGTRSLADLSFSPPLAGKTDTYRPTTTTTMSFLPGADVSGDKPADRKSDISAPMELFPQRAGHGLKGPAADNIREPEKAQLTIFYAGKVLVFDDFPSDRASDLMQLAGMKSGTANNLGLVPPAAAAATAAKATTVTMKTEVSALTNSLPVVKSQPQNQKPAQAIVSNLPIARKASLHRFLEKRKDRINANAPYQLKEDSPANSAKAAAEGHQPWLGLQSSLGGSQLGR